MGIPIRLNQNSIIHPADKYSTVVIPAEAGIQKDTGCRIKACPRTRSGVRHDRVGYLVARLIRQIYKRQRSKHGQANIQDEAM
jgi:hypothetical protein